MGVIRRQATKSSIVTYLGTFVAAFSIVAIYPLALKSYGLAQFLNSTAMLALPLVTLGTTSAIVKFFPQFKKRGESDSFLFNVLLLCFSVLAIVVGTITLIDEPAIVFMTAMNFDVMLILDHKYAIGTLIALSLYIAILVQHASNYHRVVVPAIFQSLLPKLVLPGLVLLVYYDQVDLPEFVKLYALLFGVQALGLTLYLQYLGALDIRPKLTFFRRENIRPLLTYSSYVGLNSIGSVLIVRLDIIMVGTLVNLEAVGLYSLALFASNALQNPVSSIMKISAPVISDSFENANLKRIREIYKQAANNLLIVGILGYFLVLGVFDPVLQFSPRYSEVQGAVAIFAVLGCVRLVNMAASINQQIIMYSQYYRYIIVFTISLGAINILLNYVLIGKYGVQGAAYATLIAMLTYHLAKLLFVYKTMDMHPFSQMTTRLIVLLGLCAGFYYIFPTLDSSYLQVIAYSSGLIVFYAVCLRGLRIDAEILDEVVKRLPAPLRRLYWK